MSEQKGRVEEFEVSGTKVVDTIKDLIHQVGVRRITIKNEEGVTWLEVPLALGAAGLVAGALWVPVWFAVGAIAAMVVKLRIVVERVE